MCLCADGTAKVETLRGELARAKEQARVSNAAIDKAGADLKAEQATRRQFEERVSEVEQELKDAACKCESPRRRIRPRRPNLPRTFRRPKRRGPNPRVLGRRSGRPNR